MFCGNSKKCKGKKWILQGPSPLTDILVKYVFELRRTCPTGGKKFYQHTVTLMLKLKFLCTNPRTQENSFSLIKILSSNFRFWEELGFVLRDGGRGEGQKSSGMSSLKKHVDEKPGNREKKKGVDLACF